LLRAGQIQGEGFIVFGVQTKLEPFLSVSDALKIVKKGSRFEKVTTPQSRGSQKLKNKSLNTTMAGSQSSKKFLVYCSVVIRVQRDL
jgi:hypothetical protein